MTDTNDPSNPGINDSSRAPFEQLGFTDSPGDTLQGTSNADRIDGDATDGIGGSSSLPGPLAYWSFDNFLAGLFQDTKDGPSVGIYQLQNNSAVPITSAVTRPGPDGTADSALVFNGEDTFAFIEHSADMEVTQGTIAVWVQPDQTHQCEQIILSKDESGTDNGGHFRLGIDDGGRIFLRFAEGDGGSNKAWVSSKTYFSDGEWTHVAVSFTENGITVYADGVAVPDYAWYRKEGNLDSPADATEAYILQNREPWLLGVDTSRSEVNDDPASFAANTNKLDDAFAGAISDFGLWGGFDSSDALDSGQVWDLYTNGPGDALTAASGPQPMLAGDDVINGGLGNDELNGDGGNDELNGGAGHDVLNGGYGDDILRGGNGDDVLEGGRGSDLLIGGDGDDLLVSRSDAGEQRIGQLAIGDPSRGDPDNEVNPARQKLYGWEDQPLVGDDILVGGAGKDTFLFNPQINAKRDIILEHVNDDRSIDWAGVAGENNELHDHWVDAFGIDIVADYRADEDMIAIIGHTAAPEVEHVMLDTTGDGTGDEAASVIRVYSNQHGGGGAHDNDLMGLIVVRGDLVDADAIVTEAGVTHGIVESVDDIQEALAPSGELKTTVLEDGTTVYGYDTRDAAGNLGAIVSNPEKYSDNPFRDSGLFEYASNVPEGVPQAVAVIDGLSHPELASMTFSGESGSYINVPHEGRASSLAQAAGTVAFSFVAHTPGAGKQVLFSKDAGGYVDGGHLTAWVDENAKLVVRYQSTDESVYLHAKNFEVEANESYHFAFSFDGASAELYVDGQIKDTEDLSDNPAFLNGMLGNTESLVFGASTMHRTSGELNNLKDFFDGNIDDVVVADRALAPVELFQLVAADNDFSAIGLDSSNPLNTPTDAATTGDESASDAPVLNSVVTAFSETEGSDSADNIGGSAQNDVINGLDGDDELNGGDGHDTLTGGYGDDKLIGGNGNDSLDGGRGSDLLIGGAGDDLLIARSDSGEQRIGQLAIGQPTRPDPDNEVDPERQKLKEWLDQPLVGDDILVGGEGSDTFLIAPQINAKLDIIDKHDRDDGTIKWNKVAGENDELHDHWVDSHGIDIIADYVASEDHIAVIGHTANVEVTHEDLDGDGDNESIITVISKQHGYGGAHDQDLIGQVVVFGDEVDADDIVTDANVTYGIVENIADVDEAINPSGELKTSLGDNGDTIYGYDTRDANGNLGQVTGNPFAHTDNPYLGEVSFADPSEQAPNDASRAEFDQLGLQASSADNLNGTDNHDVIHGDPQPANGSGLPGALAYWSFGNGAAGVFNDLRGGNEAAAYRLYENQAQLQVEMPLRDGPDGSPANALEFNGEDSFGFIAHDASMEVTQGTVAIWVQPDEISKGQQIVLSKDEKNAGDGGHFRLGHEDDGRIFLRFAEGDGGSNKSWTSDKAYLSEGQWTHLAVSFTADGITVYADGVAIPDYGWYRQEGNLDSPADMTEAYLLQNREPWILGADTSRTEFNDTAAEFATDDEDLDDAFAGAISDFGLWGGFDSSDALDSGQVWDLYTNGPGDALTAASGPQPMLAGDDVINGGLGNDELNGDGGNDELNGGAGHDVLNGGYGDDILRGGNGDDVLEGGRGSDLLIGGDGDDLLVSRSDAGEQRIGQLAIGDPSRGDPDNEVNPARQKLYGWEDQPLVGDDILVGGAGKDTFLFNPQINAKRDIILEHVNDDRSIDWAGVAGENNELHDHWVDAFGIDIVADYRADEDTIAIIGHTAAPEVEHVMLDTTGDGVGDEAASVIRVYSNQHGGGGAHDNDLMGLIVVRGDLVDADAIVTEAGVTHGIVESVDDIQEALAPSGELKMTVLEDGTTVYGYDTRDAAGNLGAIVSNPEKYSDNPFRDSGLFEYASNVPEGVPQAVAVIDGLSHPELASMTFSGESGSYINVPHEGRASSLAQAAGTVAFSFVAHTPGAGKQVLFSKDAGGYVDGGHLTAWVDENAKLVVRYQSTDESVYLHAKNFEVEANESYHFAFSFDGDSAELYVDGQIKDTEDLSDNPAFLNGMLGNTESLVFGASTMHRTSGELNNLKDFFDGNINDVVVLDREIYGAEAFTLSAGALDYVPTTGEQPPAEEPPAEEPPAEEPPVEEPPAEEPPAEEPPAEEPPAEEPPVEEPPAEEPPAEEPPAEEPPAEEPPAEEPPAEEPPAEEPPAEEPPAEEPPAEEPPAEEPPAEEPPAEEPPAEGPPAEGPPAEEPPVEEPPVEEPPVEEPPVEDTELTGSNDDDELTTGGGDDFIRARRGNDEINTGAGNDVIHAGSGNNKVDAGEGDDSIRSGSGNDNIEAGDGDDVIRAGSGDNEVDAGAGDDEIRSGAGKDNIEAGTGDDIVRSGAEADEVFAGEGDDVVRAGRGDDHVEGGSGEDNLAGGHGNDVLLGESGDDLLRGGAGDDELNGGLDNDMLHGHAGNDILLGEEGEDDLRGGLGQDRLDGGDGDDYLHGGRDNDTLIGGDGNDYLRGSRGDDVLFGGVGDDMYRGGQGSDQFVFTSVNNESLGFDLVRDFRGGEDRLMISEEINFEFESINNRTTVVTFSDDQENPLGAVEIRGRDFDIERDIEQVSVAELQAMDLFA